MSSRRTASKTKAAAKPASSGDVKKVHERLYSLYGDTVRIELGPEKKTAKATKEILSDEVTAQHYRVSKELRDARGEVMRGGDGQPLWDTRDADGRPIQLGKEFSYLDFNNPHVWYVYKKGTVKDPVTGQDIETFIEVGTVRSKDPYDPEPALAEARKLKR